MAESTLTAAFKDLTGDVGFFLGHGRGADNGETAWTTSEQAAVDRCVKGGLRNFYFCGYDWSFLRPVATLTLASGAQTLPLPDDFGGIEGQLTVSVSGSSGFFPIPVTGDVRRHYALNPSATGCPEMACIDPLKTTTGTQGQRFQLFVYPEADQAYTLEFGYYINPDYLNGAFPYAYGGPQHAETLLESCLAVAEKLLDDAMSVHAFEFDKRLAVSMDIDRRQKPQKLGYNGDRSDGKYWSDPRLTRETGVTFAGVLYP